MWKYCHDDVRRRGGRTNVALVDLHVPFSVAFTDTGGPCDTKADDDAFVADAAFQG